MKNSSLILLSILVFSGCGKTYTCECTNPGGTTGAFTYKGTRQKADKKCKDYYNDSFGDIPMNETSCEIR